MPVHMGYIYFKVVCHCDFFFLRQFSPIVLARSFCIKAKIYLFIFNILLSPEIEVLMKAFNVIALMVQLKDFLILYMFYSSLV